MTRLKVLSAGRRDQPIGRLWWATLTFVSAAALAGLLVQGLPHHFLDLKVYRFGSEALAEGRDLYRLRGPSGLPYTYPPFAAFLMWPLTLLPFVVEGQVVLVLNLVLTWTLLFLSLRGLRGNRWSVKRHAALALLLLPLALVLEPIQSTLFFGQVNLLLAVAIAVDLLIVPDRFRGILIGVATAIKLTPAVYVLYLLMRRKYRQAATATLSASVCTVVAFMAAPAVSREFWFHALLDNGRIGGQEYTGNQSIWGSMFRLWEPSMPPRAIWAVLVAFILGVLWWAVKHPNVTALEGYVLAGICTSLASPISWTHHLTWIVPLLVILGARVVTARSRLVGCLCFGATYMIFASQLPWRYGQRPGRHWSQGWAGQALESSYVVFMLLALVLAVRAICNARAADARPASESSSSELGVHLATAL